MGFFACHLCVDRRKRFGDRPAHAGYSTSRPLKLRSVTIVAQLGCTPWRSAIRKNRRLSRAERRRQITLKRHWSMSGATSILVALPANR
jgi:hypothetical protein